MASPVDKNFKDGILVNRYKFISFLQKGSYGRVIKGMDLQTSQVVSIKAIATKFTDVANHEIKMLTKLKGNANICQLLTSFTVGNYIYLILEYCNGGDLYDYISSKNPITSADLYLIASQLYSAIGFSHGRGIYHRDLKPENILLHKPNTSSSTDFSQFTFKVCDWGLSTTTRINDEFNVGTEKYMAPEVFINNYNSNLNLKYYDAKYVDYWSVGITLITLLFGKSPFKVIDNVNRSLINDSNYKKFVLFNEKQILFDIYPNLNTNGFNIFDNLLKISGIDDNLANFLNKINQRSLDKFMNDLKINYKFGLTIDDEFDNSELYSMSNNSHGIKTVPRKMVPVTLPPKKKLDYSLKLDKDIKIIESEILVDDLTNLNWFDY